MLIEKQRISSTQLAFLVAGLLMGSTLLVDPASGAGHLSWVVTLIGVLFSFILAGIYLGLAKKFPGESPVAYNKKLFGKFLGTIVTVGQLLVGFLAIGFIGNDFIIFRNVTLPETPIFIMLVIQALLGFYILYLGLEPLTRTSFILLLITMTSTVLVFIFAIPDMDITLFLPLATDRPNDFWQTLLTVLAYPFSELVILLMMFPLVDDQSKVKRGLFLGISLGGFMLFLASIRNVLVYGESVMKQLFPSIAVARNIGIGAFLTRIDAFVSIALNMNGFVAVAVLLYSGVLGFAQMFNLKSYRILSIPLLLPTIFLIAKLPKNLSLIAWFDQHYYRYFALIFGFIFPLIGLIISFFIKQPKPVKKRKSKGSKR